MKSFFPWRNHILQHLVYHGNSSSSGLTAAHPEGFFVYMAGGCFPTENLHSPLPLSVYHHLHLWAEPFARPNPALRDTGATPMEGNKIWVCINRSQVSSLPTIYLEISKVEASAWAAHRWKGFRKVSVGSSIPSSFFSKFCHSKTDPSAISSLLHIHLASSSQQGKNLQQCHLPSWLKTGIGTKPGFWERGSSTVHFDSWGV